MTESYKGQVHLGLFALAAICCAYNLGSALSCPDKRLKINAVIYGALVLFEAKQARSHFETKEVA